MYLISKKVCILGKRLVESVAVITSFFFPRLAKKLHAVNDIADLYPGTRLLQSVVLSGIFSADVFDDMNTGFVRQRWCYLIRAESVHCRIQSSSRRFHARLIYVKNLNITKTLCQ